MTINNGLNWTFLGEYWSCNFRQPEWNLQLIIKSSLAKKKIFSGWTRRPQNSKLPLFIVKIPDFMLSVSDCWRKGEEMKFVGHFVAENKEKKSHWRFSNCADLSEFESKKIPIKTESCRNWDYEEKVYLSDNISIPNEWVVRDTPYIFAFSKILELSII